MICIVIGQIRAFISACLHKLPRALLPTSPRSTRSTSPGSPVSKSPLNRHRLMRNVHRTSIISDRLQQMQNRLNLPDKKPSFHPGLLYMKRSNRKGKRQSPLQEDLTEDSKTECKSPTDNMKAEYSAMRIHGGSGDSSERSSSESTDENESEPHERRYNTRRSNPTPLAYASQFSDERDLPRRYVSPRQRQVRRVAASVSSAGQRLARFVPCRSCTRKICTSDRKFYNNHTTSCTSKPPSNQIASNDTLQLDTSPVETQPLSHCPTVRPFFIEELTSDKQFDYVNTHQELLGYLTYTPEDPIGSSSSFSSSSSSASSQPTQLTVEADREIEQPVQQDPVPEQDTTTPASTTETPSQVQSHPLPQSEISIVSEQSDRNVITQASSANTDTVASSGIRDARSLQLAVARSIKKQRHLQKRQHPVDDLAFEPDEEECPVQPEQSMRSTCAVLDDGQLHPCIQRILANEYPKPDDPDRNTRFVGLFPLVSGVRYTYRTKLSLFQEFHSLFPDVPISYSDFVKRTENIRPASFRTDLCETCRVMELLYADIKRRGPDAVLSPREKEFLQLWLLHDDESYIQRQSMQTDVESLRENEVLIVADFKENFKLAYTWNQVGRDWYNRHQVSCLTFLCYRRDRSGHLHKHPITFLSDILSHTSTYVLQCFEELMTLPVMNEVTSVKWWSDHGPHFFSKQTITGIARICSMHLNHPAISVSFFSPSHGKSEVDGLFGILQQILDASLPSTGIYTVNELAEFFTKNRSLIESMDNGGRIHYIFQVFASSLPIVYLPLYMTPSSNLS